MLILLPLCPNKSGLIEILSVSLRPPVSLFQCIFYHLTIVSCSYIIFQYKLSWFILNILKIIFNKLNRFRNFRILINDLILWEYFIINNYVFVLHWVREIDLLVKKITHFNFDLDNETTALNVFSNGSFTTELEPFWNLDVQILGNLSDLV